MKFNAECTVWHKSGSSYITLHYPCWWQDTESENISKTGKTDVDTVMALLPLHAEVAKSDYIAKGNIDFEITSSVTELLKAVSNFKVSTISTKDYGTSTMQHKKVTAK